MIVLTGAAGFIGSALVWGLNEAGITDIVCVDQLGTGPKWLNLRKRLMTDIIGIDDLWSWLEAPPRKIDAIFHMGACSYTTETDADFLVRNNHHYSAKLFNYCAERGIAFYYASSAATYGNGELGYDDQPELIPRLKPLNKYGFSKQLFDYWVTQQTTKPPHWAGFKFFNVYGPQEYHKGSQASVLYHAYQQIHQEGSLKLFKSYRPEIPDGEQQRDFIYVKDVVKVMLHFLNHPTVAQSGIYNVGSGIARSFKALGEAAFQALGKKSQFNWIPMPHELREQYQYYTVATLTRLRVEAGYTDPFCTLEEGAQDYCVRYLHTADPFL